jgi:hypothetical protein
MSETLSIDSENQLFHKLESDYKADFPNLISRRQYNDRRKYVTNLTRLIQQDMAKAIDEGEDMYCVESKPFEVCRLSQKKRCKIGKNDYEKAPSKGYCGYYFGYKFHALCSIKGVIP